MCKTIILPFKWEHWKCKPVFLPVVWLAALPKQRLYDWFDAPADAKHLFYTQESLFWKCRNVVPFVE